VGWKPPNFRSLDGNSPRQHRNENNTAYSSLSLKTKLWKTVLRIPLHLSFFFCSHSFEISYKPSYEKCSHNILSLLKNEL
jgi:hypothetical protein